VGHPGVFAASARSKSPASAVLAFLGMQTGK